jgi:hypothetical protein
VQVTEPIALKLVENASQIEDLVYLQNFGEKISGIRPECERWTELSQERADHHVLGISGITPRVLQPERRLSFA